MNIQRRWAAIGAVLATLALAVSYAQTQTIHDEGGEATGGGGSGSYDSTTRTLLNGGADTTAWVDIRNLSFANCCMTGKPMIRMIASSSSGIGTTDSIGFVVQWASDPPHKDRPYSIAKVYKTGASPILVEVWNCNGLGGVAFFRVISTDEDVTRTSAWPNYKTTLMFNAN